MQEQKNEKIQSQEKALKEVDEIQAFLKEIIARGMASRNGRNQLYVLQTCGLSALGRKTKIISFPEVN